MVLDALTYAGNLENLAGLDRDPRYLFVRGDICDEAAVRALLEQHRIDTIVHFAAESHVDRSILGPDDFIRTNVVGTHSLLKAAKALWLDRKTVPAHRFHHVSTDEVYGSLGPDDAPFHEANPVRAQFAVLGEQGRLGSSGARLSRDLRTRYDDHQLLQQLRAVPVSGETDSAHAHQHPAWARRCRCTATACRCAIGCTWPTIARRLRSR